MLLGRSRMSTITIAVVIFFRIALILAVASMLGLSRSQQRTRELRSRFGPEYRRMARAEGDAAAGESVLLERQKRVAKLDIQPLTEGQRNEFADAWEHAQAEFVDDPVA